MDYCVSHANDSRNLAFLSPFFGALRQCMEIFPEEAYDRLSGIAYIPVMHRSYILNFSTIARPPQLRMVFWERCSKPLRKMTDPIFQLDVERATARGPDDNRFTRQIFVASFDALWCYKDERKSLKSNPDSLAAVQVTETTTWWRYLSQQVTEKTTWWRNRFLQVTEKTTWWRIRFPQVTEKTAWWRILFQIWLKTHIKTHNYVETHDFSIEFYDNPAIAALVSYKWNTIGYWYWFTRYVFQCCFYLLVLTAALMQVYYPMPSRLVGVFIAIIFMALNFLWLEFVQARRSPRCYTKCGHNVLDILAFLLPLCASIDQLVVISKRDPQGNTRALSFSVLVVFLHMVFELRINQSVCKFVTIIKVAVYETGVFFILFGVGILAFAIAILHLLRSCPYEGCAPSKSSNSSNSSNSSKSEFSTNFFTVLFNTYFFMVK
ncbi:hypothetical protein EDD21DRAFT_428026 [Dissophora ornata]|nr:hypothetical protein EDD21DRAFT_428026 [Dissophora ornata]